MCKQYWRRRFFKLAGTKLTAYHESTLQPRATINLAKASKLIDDKPALTQKEVSTKGGRRKSAFAEEEEGYMFVEEGFRIRFANGEVIDFYADSAAAKDEWMKVLCEVVGKHPSSVALKGWTEMVLKREKSIMARERKVKPEAMPASSSPTKGGRERQKLMQTHSSEMPTRPASAREKQTAGFDFGGPSPDARSQLRAHAPRPQGHMRTEESYRPQSQLPEPTARSQANSPAKKKISPEERRKKARSMIDMMYH
jgi:PH domain